MTSVNLKDLIELYGLQPHPEGGYFKETYRASETVVRTALPERFGGDRNFSTAIYFLLPEGSKSHLHRIKSDEVWHFYLGGPLTLVQISPEGKVEKIILGQDVKNGHKVQHVVPRGYWFGASPNKGARFSFVGCTVAPGFDFEDFEMGKREELLRQFPDSADVIEKFT